MTSQIFLDILSHGFMKLDRINLIVFDECHRAVSNHPMRQIMQRFEDCPKEKQPRVLAMSATLLNANVKLHNLETTIRVKKRYILFDIYSFSVTLQSFDSLKLIIFYSPWK